MATRSADVERYIAPSSERQIGFVIHENGDSLAVRREQFRLQWVDALRYLHDHAAHSARERQICQDALRGRMSFNALEAIVTMAARSERPFLIEATLRGAVIQRIASVPPCADEASELEQDANAPLDLAQIIAAREQTPIRWTHVAELAAQQEFASRRLHAAALVRARRIAR